MLQVNIGKKTVEIEGSKVIVNLIGMMYNVCNRHPLVRVSRLLVVLQLYIIQQRVSFFCAKFRIYSFIVKSLEERREQLQPIMDNVSKEIKEYGTVKMLLPEAGTLERAATYRDKKIKPLFLQIKNKVGAMAAQVKELTKEVENWKSKYQKLKQKYNGIQKELDDMRKENHKLSEEKNIMQGVSDRYDRVVRVLGIETVDAAVQQDIHNEKALEEKQRMEQMPKGSIHERLAWGVKKSEMENQQRKKNKSKHREMER